MRPFFYIWRRYLSGDAVFCRRGLERRIFLEGVPARPFAGERFWGTIFPIFPGREEKFHEQFPFETLGVPNHTTWRFAEKTRFFRLVWAGRRCTAASRFTFFKAKTLMRRAGPGREIFVELSGRSCPGNEKRGHAFA